MKMENEILENLRKAVHEFDNDSAAAWARKAVVEEGAIHVEGGRHGGIPGVDKDGEEGCA